MPLYNLTFSSDCTTLDVGCYLKIWTGTAWENADAQANVVGGKFSDGVNCYTVVNGVITAKVSCFPYETCLNYVYVTPGESCTDLISAYDSDICNV